MFISYQAVRNTFIASVIAGSAGVIYVSNKPAVVENIGVDSSSVAQPLLSPGSQPSPPPVIVATAISDKPTTPIPIVAPASETARIPVPESKPEINISQNSDEQLLQAAMRIASAPALKKGTDVLGPQSRWKLNLYDDNADGVWDRGKLDTNRDDQDDEKWNFKKGRWEKEGGGSVWDGSKWQSDAISKQVSSSESASSKTIEPAVQSKATTFPTSPKSDDSKTIENNLTKYRDAMRIANAPAVKGKGKDVLGPSSPWKLNLYDDNNDGQWDRGKLDYNRDDMDDEKWNFKQGHWERDGGHLIWDGTNWKKS